MQVAQFIDMCVRVGGCLKCDRGQIIPQVPYADLQRGLSDEQLTAVKKTGVIIVKGGVPREVQQLALQENVRLTCKDI